MKTAYLNLRIAPDDKQLLSDLAWQHRMSMSEMVTLLIRKAAADELGQELKVLKDDIAAAAPFIVEKIKQDRAAAAPRRANVTNVKTSAQQKAKLNDIAATAEYMPGDSPDCSPSCRWFLFGDCTHPDYKDTWDTKTITGDCTRYEPQPHD